MGTHPVTTIPAQGMLQHALAAASRARLVCTFSGGWSGLIQQIWEVRRVMIVLQYKKVNRERRRG